MKLSGPLTHPDHANNNDSDSHRHRQTPRIWVLLADQRRMRVYSRKNHEIVFLGEGVPEDEEIFPKRLSPKNRVFSSCSRFVRHTIEKHMPFRQKSLHRFARSMVDWLSHAQQQDLFDKIVLVSAPRFLGVLRAEMPATLTPYIVAEIDKDLINMPQRALQKELDAILWLQPSS